MFDKIKQQLSVAQSSNYCEYCNTEIDFGQSLCGTCRTQEPSFNQCGHCGFEIDEDEELCEMCSNERERYLEARGFQ